MRAAHAWEWERWGGWSFAATTADSAPSVASWSCSPLKSDGIEAVAGAGWLGDEITLRRLRS